MPESAPPSPARLPWDIHPALSEERLRICARMLANARRDALALAQHELGDDPWSVGCRAFAFSRHRLRRVAEAGHYDWLEVLDQSHHFVFLVGGVPVRFYRGLAEEPTARTLRRQEIEAQQLCMALGEGAEEDGLVFRLAVETEESGRVHRVVFLALRGDADRAECFWPIPLDVAPSERERLAAQLRLIPDDGYEGPKSLAKPLPSPRHDTTGSPRRRKASRG